MTVPTEKPGFAALQREWYAKLDATGFDDLERGTRDHHNVFSDLSALHEVEMYRRGQRSGNAEFFRLAQQWLGINRWRTRRERIYFAAWADGRMFEHLVREHPCVPGGSRSNAQWRHQRAVEAMLDYFRSHQEDADRSERGDDDDGE